MKVARMKAERRTALGRNHVAQLRKQGWLPAVVYGEGGEPVSISISEWELDQHVKQHHRIYHLDIEGKRQDAYLQEVSWHAISDRPLHVDFKRIDLTKPIDIDVEVTFTGHPVGLAKGGVLIKDHQQIRVRSLPTEIPESLEVKIVHLDMDESLLAKEVPLPEGVTLISAPDMVVCHVAKLVVQAAAEPAPAAAEAVPAEGTAPAAGAAPAGGAPAAAPAKDAKDKDKDKKG